MWCISSACETTLRNCAAESMIKSTVAVTENRSSNVTSDADKLPQVLDFCLRRCGLFGLKIKTNKCHWMSTLDLLIPRRWTFPGWRRDVTCQHQTKSCFFLSCQICLYHEAPSSSKKNTSCLNPRTGVETFPRNTEGMKVMQTSRKSIVFCRWTWEKLPDVLNFSLIANVRTDSCNVTYGWYQKRNVLVLLFIISWT